MTFEGATQAPGVVASPAARRHSRWRIARNVVVGCIGALIVAYAAYDYATTPKSMPGRVGLYAFDPEAVGQAEQKAWAAYYLHQWPTLFDLMLRMTRGAFGLSLPQAVYASYLNTYAQMVWSRQGAQDGLAEAYMRRFYEYVKEPTGGRYDVNRAAQLEVEWWAVHRNREQYPDHSALAAALAATYAEVYQMPADRMLPAGEARAAAMDLSDQWNREGKDPNSLLLGQIADLLVQSYRSLSEAVAPA